jgi:hypothetical protein
MLEGDPEDFDRERQRRRVMVTVDMIYGENKARYGQALAAGPLALLQLRADWILRHADTGEVEITEEEKEDLERIAASPRDGDGFWLSYEYDNRLDEIAERLI